MPKVPREAIAWLESQRIPELWWSSTPARKKMRKEINEHIETILTALKEYQMTETKTVPEVLNAAGHTPGSGWAVRSCTCHPSDDPPTPCPQQYGISGCRRAAFIAVTRGANWRADCPKCVASKFTCDEHFMNPQTDARQAALQSSEEQGR